MALHWSLLKIRAIVSSSSGLVTQFVDIIVSLPLMQAGQV